jgi:hypothetical protein
MEKGGRRLGRPLPALYSSGAQDYSLGSRFYDAGQGSQDYSQDDIYAANRLGAPYYSLADYAGQYAGTQDYTEADAFYADDAMALAASDAVDSAASPDGYGYVETNEFFECEDGVRKIGPK